ncbi:uncharacterized protein CMU_023240 [Cryptosporidium muris RN66]|uniref:Uncharacterized protein n=1 Tax=Cryptosporidium muris (strain RN66) TaxID=441375 RepID=B6ABW6_CRYMR|nr:uncharacterized protein CMU_023240 [Cryptosporidium muris RN66]EEA05319.1 hypothetical protein CMU_023240 [Cryptosporidium muris RN66]|eukprot:XP_002139668.1 hypothetical protein [Cryptosporidium muris RN66]
MKLAVSSVFRPRNIPILRSEERNFFFLLIKVSTLAQSFITLCFGISTFTLLFIISWTRIALVFEGEPIEEIFYKYDGLVDKLGYRLATFLLQSCNNKQFSNILYTIVLLKTKSPEYWVMTFIIILSVFSPCFSLFGILENSKKLLLYSLFCTTANSIIQLSTVLYLPYWCQYNQIESSPKIVVYLLLDIIVLIYSLWSIHILLLLYKVLKWDINNKYLPYRELISQGSSSLLGYREKGDSQSATNNILTISHGNTGKLIYPNN